MKKNLFDIGDKNAPDREAPPEPDDSPSTTLNLLGRFLLGYSLASAVLNWIGYEFILLSWVNHWGEGMGWIIRVLAGIVGAVLMVSFKITYKEPEQEAIDPVAS